jgi:RNA polymerase sigma-70 factor (ECF subfamily)
MEEALAEFQRHRRRLKGIAYRMLGSAADAEDIVQDAWLRLQRSGPETVDNPAAWLSRTVTRLSLDALKSARHRRETYIGPWLPEPVLEPTEYQEDAALDLSTTLMLALERLSPLERAAFLLHDVFGAEFEEVAAAISRTPTACRQLAARAREHLREARPRYRVPPEEGERLARAFAAASASGDASALSSLLARDVVLLSDGGGKRPAALNPIIGQDKVERFLLALAAKSPPQSVRFHPVNGMPGFVSIASDGGLQTTALEISEGRIIGIHIMRNPDKLTHLRWPG